MTRSKKKEIKRKKRLERAKHVMRNNVPKSRVRGGRMTKHWVTAVENSTPAAQAKARKAKHRKLLARKSTEPQSLAILETLEERRAKRSK